MSRPRVTTNKKIVSIYNSAEHVVAGYPDNQFFPSFNGIRTKHAEFFSKLELIEEGEGLLITIPSKSEMTVQEIRTQLRRHIREFHIVPKKGFAFAFDTFYDWDDQGNKALITIESEVVVKKRVRENKVRAKRILSNKKAIAIMLRERNEREPVVPVVTPRDLAQEKEDVVRIGINRRIASVKELLHSDRKQIDYRRRIAVIRAKTIEDSRDYRFRVAEREAYKIEEVNEQARLRDKARADAWDAQSPAVKNRVHDDEETKKRRRADRKKRLTKVKAQKGKIKW